MALGYSDAAMESWKHVLSARGVRQGKPRSHLFDGAFLAVCFWVLIITCVLIGRIIANWVHAFVGHDRWRIGIILSAFGILFQTFLRWLSVRRSKGGSSRDLYHVIASPHVIGKVAIAPEIAMSGMFTAGISLVPSWSENLAWLALHFVLAILLGTLGPWRHAIRQS
jgi:hypothetical protein